MFRHAALAFGLFITTPALAGGTASPAPPPEPVVDLSELPGSTLERPLNQDGEPHQVQAQLLVDHAAAQPGDTVRIGLHLTQDKDWHTYYRWWGGMIGLPTEVQWTVPEGWNASDIAFPLPQRFEQSDLVSFGYEDKVLLISELQVPSDAAPGAYPIALSANWLVCKEQCIPGEVKELSTTLEVAEARRANGTTELFDHYEARLPQPITEFADVAVEFALSSSAVRPYDTFKAAVLVNPIGDATIEWAGEQGPWPAFTASSSFDWMLLDLSLIHI